MSTTSVDYHDELCALQAKMNSLVSEIVRAQEHMDDLVRKSVTRNKQIHALEREAEDLRRENERLRREQKKPDSGNANELMNAIAARDAVFKKLRLTYQVTYDVLKAYSEELKFKIDQLPGPDTELDAAQEHIARRNHLMDIQSQVERSPSTASTSSGTSSPASARSPRSTPKAPKAAPVRASRSEPGPSRAPRASPLIRSPTDVSSPPSVTVIDDRSTGNTWRIHDETPEASELVCGPIAPNVLKKVVGNRVEPGDLDSLETTTGYPPNRLLFTPGKLGFALDPIIAEAPSGKSYILDWADQQTIASESYAALLGPQNLHTFVFPRNERAWYYIGKLTWQVVEVNSILDQLTQADRAIVTKRLCRRQKRFTEAQIKERLENRELRHLVIELSSDGHKESTFKLAERMGYNIKQMNGQYEFN